MTLEEILVAVLALAVGAAFCFAGFKFFLILLPIWAFFIGLLGGAQAMTALFGDGFLSTVTGWVVGVVVGIAFAILSYLFYWIAVILLGGTIGYAVGAGIMGAIGFDQGLILVLVALAVGAVFAVGTALLRAPKYLVIVLSAFGGSAAMVAGILLLLGTIKLGDLQYGIVRVALDEISDNVLWAIIWAGIGAAGVLFQVQSTSLQDSIEVTEYRYA